MPYPYPPVKGVILKMRLPTCIKQKPQGISTFTIADAHLFDPATEQALR